MQAKDHPLSVVLQERQQWVIPVYQRTYAWESGPDKQIPQIWDDLRDRAVERLAGEKPKPHFVGAIIYAEPSEQLFGTVNKRYLVDGQQRITTFNLILCALRHAAIKNRCERMKVTLEEYIFNAKSASMADPNREQFKLWSSSFDRPLFLAIAQSSPDEIKKVFSRYFFQNGKLIWGQAPRLLAAFWYLLEQIDSFISERNTEGRDAETTLEALLSGFLSGFQIVVVQLGRDDDAQSIFASLNGKAQPLTAFDLIRNDIFHRARKALEDDDVLYEEYWKELETEFWKQEVKQGRLKRPRTDHLITHTMVAQTAQDINVGQVANEYSRFAKERAFPSVGEEIQSLIRYARIYEQMEQASSDAGLSRISSLLRIWDTSAFHPLILWVSAAEVSVEERNSIFRLIESYIIRRDICGLTNKNYNRVIAAFLKELHHSRNYLDNLQEHISTLQGDGSRMPDDRELTSAVLRQPSYHTLGSRKLRYVFVQVDTAMRTKFDEAVSVNTDNLTVEHIMPARWAAHWPLPSGTSVKSEDYFLLLGGDIQISEQALDEVARRERLKNTLGNLTLITDTLNPSIGNNGWPEKKLRIAKSLLAVNRDIADNIGWGEVQIEARSLRLSQIINEVWPGTLPQRSFV